MKYTRQIASSGIILFLLLILVTAITSLIGPLILPSLKYIHDVLPIAIAISIFTGLSLLVSHLQRIQKSILATRTRKPDKNEKLSPEIPMLLCISLFIGFLTFAAIIKVSATLLHQTSPKQNISLEVLVNSAWPSRGDLSGKCPYGLVFDTPRISFLQTVCINQEQWRFFQNQKMPITVVLTGQESYFGYDLKCCK